MTDRELLEYAAKAAGLDHLWVVEIDGISQNWNPLTDDGDALRLTVKLRLNLIFEEWDGVEYVCAIPHRSYQGQDEVIGDNETADTRRAIVRAAAEIGKALTATPTSD